LSLAVQDDGIGVPPTPVAGYGLRNMRDRARMLGGELDLISGDGKGTKVRLRVPWNDMR